MNYLMRGSIEVSNKVLIVESENDQFFFQAIIDGLNCDNESLEHVCNIDDYECLGGMSNLKAKLTEIKIDSQIAVSLGLILNELLSNALKYAFPDNKTGEIHISMQTKNEIITIGVEDDGIGLPAGFDLETTNSMGMIIAQIQ